MNIQHNGFTLLETLVVISLIGIILGFISLSPNLVNIETRLEQEQQRFYHLLKLLSDRAILENQPYGVLIDQQQYHFYRYQPELEAWLTLETDKSLYNRHFAAHLHWQLQLSGQRLIDKPQNPQLIFFPDGQHIPFQASLSTDQVSESEFIIKGDGIAFTLP